MNGPGIRTLVHFKGCNLRCSWCSTPESQRFQTELSYEHKACIGCGLCISSCPEGAIHFSENGKIGIQRQLCTECMACTQACCAGALSPVGRNMTAEELLEMALRDKNLYQRSGGGVTLSGGEVLLQVNDVMIQFIRGLKENDISIGFDTAGCVSKKVIERVIPYADFFLWDVKQLDGQRHQEVTGRDNRQILDNLKFVDAYGSDIYLRCPIIPGVNNDDNYFQELVCLAKGLNHLKEIHLFPFHKLGIARYEKIGRKHPYETMEMISDTYIADKKKYLEANGFKTKIIG